MGRAGVDPNGKVELASDAWLAAARQIAADLVAESGAAIPGQRVSICEVFHRPPAHLRIGGDKIFWTLVMGADESSATRKERSDADIFIETEYERALIAARTVYPEVIAEPAADAPPLTPAGEALARLSPELRMMLRRLHNRLAVITR
jgi:hypothetical protein